MKVALTPIGFARRARKLYAKREAVIDGDLRYTYEEFLARCDRGQPPCKRWESESGPSGVYCSEPIRSLTLLCRAPIGAVLVPSIIV